MPLDQVITDFPGFKILDVLGQNFLKIKVSFEGVVFCPHCNSESLRKKDTFWRKVRHICLGNRLSELQIKTHKFLCKSCGRYFNQRFPGVLPYMRATEPFRQDVFQRHHDGITRKKLAENMELGQATIERWYKDFVKLEDKKFDRSLCPRVLGIDEHFFTKKKGYATTLADLSKSRVFDVTLGRSEKSLKGYLSRLRGKDNVRVVLMDMSETYRSIVKKHFPQALIVADRFHVVRLVNQRFLETWKLLDPERRKNRGLLSLMRRHEHNLSLDQHKRLRAYLKSVPGLESIYDFKQDLMGLVIMKKQKRKRCLVLAKEFLSCIEQLKNSGFEPLKSLGETLDRWKNEIARMWRFTKTNSITEGLHNKMEMISRRAFGFRNFQNYRLRVRALCG